MIATLCLALLPPKVRYECGEHIIDVPPLRLAEYDLGCRFERGATPVKVAMYSVDNNAAIETSLKVVRAGRRRADGTWEGRVGLNLTVQADVRVKLALRVPRAVGDADVRMRVGAAQERREECVAYEDP